MSRELKKLREDYIDGEKFHDNDINDITTDVNLLIDKTEEIDNDKQDKLTAGDFISIDDDNVISVVNLLDDLNVSTGTTYSSAKIFEMITQFGFYIEVVDELPASGETKTIYFVRVVDTGNTENSGYTDYCDEYMWVDNEWELIGTTRIDLSDYYTKSETDALLEKKADKPLYEHFHVKALANSGNPITVGISDAWGISEAQYSLDQETWSAMTTATTVSLNEGESVYIRQITKKADGYRPAKITTTGPISLHGNINDLVDYTEPYQTSLSGRSHIFSSYFSGNNYITDASELILPYTDLSDGCYGYMFNGCTSLVYHPALPSTNLTRSCYSGMFWNCTSLTTAPELPATTLADRCYESMFNGCTSLTTAPELPSTTLADWCYCNMFCACTSLTTAPELPATTLAASCYYSMFNGCTSLNYVKCLAVNSITTANTTNWLTNVSDSGSFVKPENAIWGSGDSGIPDKWIQYRMYNDAELDATLRSKVDKPLYEHFHVKALANGGNPSTVSLQNYNSQVVFIAQYSLSDDKHWVDMPTGTTFNLSEGQSIYIRQKTLGGPARISIKGRVSLHGNINDLVDYTNPYLIDLTGRDNVFSNYFGSNTAIVDASELILPYTKLSSGCYNGMFSGCTGLVKAPQLPASTLSRYCYSYMFYGCTSLTTAPELPATTLVDSCYSDMFYGCTSLTTAPELPATTLAHECYYSMFNGCTSLNYVKCLATDISAADCTSGWVNSVSDNGIFIKDVHTTWPTGDSGIPSGWRIVNHYDDFSLEDNLSTKVDSSTIRTIWSGTQQEYDALQTYSNDTLYVIKFHNI